MKETAEEVLHSLPYDYTKYGRMYREKDVLKAIKNFHNSKLQLSNKQRLTALKNCLKTLDAFCIPSLSPKQFTEYEKIKKTLIKRYD